MTFSPLVFRSIHQMRKQFLLIIVLMTSLTLNAYGVDSTTQEEVEPNEKGPSLFVGPYGQLTRVGNETGYGTGIHGGAFFLSWLGAAGTFMYSNFAPMEQYGIYVEPIARIPFKRIQPSLSWVFGHNWLNTDGNPLALTNDIAGWVTGPATNVDFILGKFPISLGLRFSYLVALENTSASDQVSVYMTVRLWL